MRFLTSSRGQWINAGAVNAEIGFGDDCSEWLMTAKKGAHTAVDRIDAAELDRLIAERGPNWPDCDARAAPPDRKVWRYGVRMPRVETLAQLRSLVAQTGRPVRVHRNMCPVHAEVRAHWQSAARVFRGLVCVGAIHARDARLAELGLVSGQLLTAPDLDRLISRLGPEWPIQVRTPKSDQPTAPERAAEKEESHEPGEEPGEEQNSGDDGEAAEGGASSGATSEDEGSTSSQSDGSPACGADGSTETGDPTGCSSSGASDTAADSQDDTRQPEDRQAETPARACSGAVGGQPAGNDQNAAEDARSLGGDEGDAGVETVDTSSASIQEDEPTGESARESDAKLDGEELSASETTSDACDDKSDASAERPDPSKDGADGPDSEDVAALFRAHQGAAPLNGHPPLKNPSWGGVHSDMHRVAQLRATASSRIFRRVAKRLDQLFIGWAVAAQAELSSPRISGRKLVRELVGRSYRLSRCRREEVERPLIIAMADVSGSCSAAADETLAACLALCDHGRYRVLVVEHSNGWGWALAATDRDDIARFTRLVGPKNKPDRSEQEELAAWSAFIAQTGQIAGVLALGDTDAEWLYGHVARGEDRRVPIAWLDSHCACDGVQPMTHAERQRLASTPHWPGALPEIWMRGVNSAETLLAALRMS